MTAQISHVNGHQVIFGLKWVALTGEKKEAVQAREEGREVEASFKVRFQNPHVIAYGFCTKEEAQGKKKAPLIAASMLLATMPNVAPNSVWIEVHDQEARMAILVGGVPSAAGDFVGSVFEAEKIVSQLQQDLGEPFLIYGNHVDFYPNTILMPLADLVDAGDIAAATLTKIGIEISWPLVAALFLAAVCAGGYAYYQHAKNVKLELLRQRHKGKSPVDATKLYQEALKRALPTAGLPTSQAAKVLIGEWRYRESYEGGWRLLRLECAPESCLYVWNAAGGNNQSLRAALGPNAYDFSLNGQEVKYQLPIRSAETKLLDVTHLPTNFDFMLTTGSFFQDLRLIGVEIVIGQTAVFGVDAGSADLKSIKSPVRAGAISIVGKGALLEEIMQKLPDNITFQRLDYALDNASPKFRLQGNYYVKD